MVVSKLWPLITLYIHMAIFNLPCTPGNNIGHPVSNQISGASI